jgi:citrate synthase
LFDVDELERLAAASRRPPRPRSTIDVRISSEVTSISEDGVLVRGHDLCEVARLRSFEAVCELLWTGELPTEDPVWPAITAADRRLLDPVVDLQLDPIARLAVGAHLLDADASSPADPAVRRAGDLGADVEIAMDADAGPGNVDRSDLDRGHASSFDATRRLLIGAPHLLGSPRRTGSIAHRLASAWVRRPDPASVRAVDAMLGLLADHELATSTLAVRVAASVRSSPLASISAGLATLQGPLHGAASVDAAKFLEQCRADGVDTVVERYRRRRASIPGFGHKVYRDRDPRFDVAMDAIRELGDTDLVDDVVSAVTRVVAQPPNIDLALAALTHRLGVPGTSIFAVARIAGWAAHHDEELREAPLRYRGVAS